MGYASLGSDPEFFIQTLDGKLKSIIGMIGGTKENPKIIDDHGQFKIQEDNVAAEYNIPASHTKEKFVQHILWPQKYISHLLGTDKFKIYPKASASFPVEELKHPKAQEFGCDPDYDAWNLSINEKPSCDDPNFRTAGGHIHIGVRNKDPMNLVRIIRNMDKYLGIWSVIIDPDNERRKLYGKAGCFRPQPHGCEYRTLSNFWIFSPELIGEVWDRTQAAVKDKKMIDDPKESELIQTIINTGDIDAARQYCRNNGL